MNLNPIAKLLGEHRRKAATSIEEARRQAETLRRRKAQLLEDRAVLLSRPVTREDFASLFESAIGFAKETYPKALRGYLQNASSGLQSRNVATLDAMTPETMLNVAVHFLTCNIYSREAIAPVVVMALLGDAMLPHVRNALAAIPWESNGQIALAEARKRLAAIDDEIARIDAELQEIAEAAALFGEQA